MQAELASIHIGEEVSPEQRDQQQTQQTKGEETTHEDFSSLQAFIQKLEISVAKRFKAMFKTLVKAGKAAEGAPSRRVAMLLDLFRKQKHHQGWNNRARKEVGREQSKHDRFSKRNKKVASHSGQEEHRHKNNADADRRDKCRDGDLLGSIQNCLVQ